MCWMFSGAAGSFSITSRTMSRRRALRGSRARSAAASAFSTTSLSRARHSASRLAWLARTKASVAL